MNFFTYLWLRFTQSMVYEFAVGILCLPFVVLMLVLYAVLYPVIWLGTVYEDWKGFKDQDV